MHRNVLVLRQKTPRLKWRRVHAVLGFTICFCGFFFFAPRLSAAPPGAATAKPGDFRPDRILLKPKAGRTTRTLEGLHAAHRNLVLQSFPRLDNLQIVQLAPGQAVADAIAAYQASGLVEFAEPDYYVHAFAFPNDPKFRDGTQWNLYNTGQSGGVAGADIHAPEGWSILTSASNIIVAVVDSGIRYTHEDLAQNMWVNPGEIPGNGIDDDGDGYVDDVHGINAITHSGDPKDDYGHGTFVAGVIGAVGNNTRGIAGVAWRVQLMACKFLDQTGNGDTGNAITCINYAIQHGAKIINTSWGSYSYSAALETAMRKAQSSGVIFVAASGNEGLDNDAQPTYPASLPLRNVLSVAGTTRTDELDTTYSNYGAKSVHLGAPGSAIYSCWATNTANPRNSDFAYTIASGTSASAPHVTGALALMAARYPGVGYDELVGRLLAATDPLPSLAGKCITGGRLNLAKALKSTVIADFTPSSTYGATPLSVQFTNNSYGAVASQSWDFGDNSPLVADANPTHVYTGEGNFTVTLTVTDAQGVTSTKSRQITAIANYQIQPADYQWIDPSAMTRLRFSSGALSRAATLPFTLSFYGAPYRQLYVSPQGLAYFSIPPLDFVTNTALPNPANPYATICPYWDNLSTFDGAVYIGAVGTAPNRRFVVSWVNVPRAPAGSPPLTFQAILAEGSNQILFQYREVHPENNSSGGRLATIGLNNVTIAAQFSFNGVPQTLTNGQTVSFTPASRGTLDIAPASGLEFSGNVGGPFGPDSLVYVLLNSGQGTLDWLATNRQVWLTLSPTNGTLGPGQSTNVSASVNANALGLGGGSYLDTITFLNLKNGVGNATRSVALFVNGSNSVLEVSPDIAYDAVGPPGGPFRPLNRLYTLLNSGDATLSWTATKDQDWINLSSFGGTLHPGESTVITVSFAPAAAALAASNYTGRVDFVNATSAVGNTSRDVHLLTTLPPRLTVSATSPAAGFAFRLSGETGKTYVLEASADLLLWTPVSTNLLGPDGIFDFTDPQAGQFNQRFYRGRLVP